MEEQKSANCEKGTDTKGATSPGPKDGTKKFWSSLEHAGPMFERPYQRLPEGVHLKYKGKEVQLSEKAEEAAVLYARKLKGFKIASKEKFQTNFFQAWTKLMTEEDRATVTDLSGCDFSAIKTHLVNMGRNIQQDIIDEKKHKYCIVDGIKEKVGNYKIQTGIFCPKGDSDNMGMIQERILPEDVIINCSEGKEPIPPKGHQWKEVVHNNKAAWLAKWEENVQNKIKYMYLNSSSDQQQNVDRVKYETARTLTEYISDIQNSYRKDWEADDRETRERGVVLYLLDMLAMRPGKTNAATTGCCTLKVKHVILHGNNEIQFDYIGKSNVKDNRRVTVEEKVYENLKSFKKVSNNNLPEAKKESACNDLDLRMENLKIANPAESVTGSDVFENSEPKNDDHPLFEHLKLTTLNNYLEDLMPNLTAKVFRTHRACVTFEKNLKNFTPEDGTEKEKIAAFKKATAEVAKLCNHKKARTSLTREETSNDKEDNLMSSKECYIDPRIIIAWCIRNGIPIEKCYGKQLREKHEWAIKEIRNSGNFVFPKV